MIRCVVEVYLKKKWRAAVRLGEYKRVEDARKAMFAVRDHFGVPARLMTRFGTVVDATHVEDPNA